MSIPRLSALVALVLWLVPLSPRAALDPGTGNAPADPAVVSLTGQLLVAAPDMPDPRFAHTVILIVRHDKNGALGIVLNRPVEERSFADLLKALGDKNPDVKGPDAKGDVQIFAGGPVQQDLGFVVHSADYRRADTLSVTSQISLTASPDILRDMAQGHGPKKAIVAFGYAGWGPGQLDNEMSHGGWVTATADPALVFDEDRAKLWDTALAHRTINL